MSSINLTRNQFITIFILAIFACFAIGAGGGMVVWYLVRPSPRQAAPLLQPQPVLPPANTPIPLPTNTPTVILPSPTPRVFEFEGQGSEVWTISTNGGVAIVSSAHRGDGNFSAWLYEKESGRLVDVIANCIDDCEDQKVSRIPPGEYLLEVRARGNYILIMELE